MMGVLFYGAHGNHHGKNKVSSALYLLPRYVKNYTKTLFELSWDTNREPLKIKSEVTLQ